MNLDYLSKICLLIAQKYQEVHETKILKFDPAKVKELNDELLKYRILAKEDLIEAIGNLLDDDSVKKTFSYGACGHWSESGLPGIFYVNYSRHLEPWQGTGKGNAHDLKQLRWIPVKYKHGSHEFNYCLDLNCGDLDIGTGEFHTNYTKLQMHKTLYSDGSEIGGQNIKKGEIKKPRIV